MEVLESAVNLALSYEPEAAKRLSDHAGRMIRIKTINPDWMFYLALRKDGVQFYSDCDEPVDVRVTLPTSLLSQYILGSKTDPQEFVDSVRLSGDTELLDSLLSIALEFSLWNLVKRILKDWLPEFDGVTGLIDALKRHDPAWIVRLEHLPQLANETLQVVRLQGELQQTQIMELNAIKQQLASDRKMNRISTIIGLCLIVVAFCANNGFLTVPVLDGFSLDTLVLLVLALVILVPRIISGR